MTRLVCAEVTAHFPTVFKQCIRDNYGNNQSSGTVFTACDVMMLISSICNTHKSAAFVNLNDTIICVVDLYRCSGNIE